MRSLVSRALPCGLAALLAACSDGPRDVVIETYDVYDAHDAATRVDRTYEGEVALLVPNGDGYDVHDDPEITPGQVLFRGVPPGRHFIAYRRPGQSPNFVENGASRISNVDKHVGREASPAAEGTQIRVTAEFVAPWKATNQLEIFSERAYMYRRARASAEQANAPIADVVGATEWTLTLDEMSDPYGRFTPLVDASENDDLALFVSEVVRPNEALDLSDPWSAYAYRTITARADVTGATFVDGDVTDLLPTFTAVEPLEVTLDLRANAIREALTAGTDDLVHYTYVALEAHAEPVLGADDLIVGHGGRLFATATTVWTVDDGEGNLTHPGDIVQTVTYGNPFGSRRIDMGGVYVYAYFDVVDPVTSELESIVIDYVIFRPLAELASGPIAPTTTVPRNIRVGGLPVPLVTEGTVGSVGLTPRIEWDAPSSGGVTEYGLEIYDTENEYEGEDLVSEGRTVARATTTQTSFVVPEDVLESGHHYAVLVTARTERGDLVYVGAQAASGYFTP